MTSAAAATGGNGRRAVKSTSVNTPSEKIERRPIRRKAYYRPVSPCFPLHAYRYPNVNVITRNNAGTFRSRQKKKNRGRQIAPAANEGSVSNVVQNLKYLDAIVERMNENVLGALAGIKVELRNERKENAMGWGRGAVGISDTSRI